MQPSVARVAAGTVTGYGNKSWGSGNVVVAYGSTTQKPASVEPGIEYVIGCTALATNLRSI